MRHTILLGVSVLMLAACTTGGTSETAPVPAPETSTHAQAPLLPPDTLPATEAADVCPYLDTPWVEQTNGQRVTRLGVDNRFDPPACVFWSYQDDPQLTVLVRHMADTDAAIAVVDWAAPIATTDPAEEPTGWSGGRFGGDNHAVYAVQKGPTAVVVFSNQEQSIKAELVAKETITRLGL